MSIDVSGLLTAMAKKHGAGSIMLYGDTTAVALKRISTGLPSLDLIIGGGLPEGKIIEIYGPESSGKTSLAIKFLAEVQKAYPEKRVAFIDVEHALNPEYAKSLGLDMDNIIISQPDSAEQALNIMQELASSGLVKAVILDSVAQLVPLKELNGEIGDAEMGMRARLMGASLRKLPPVASKNECTCFFINQVRMSLGVMYGNPEVRPGGNALRFAASLIIRTSISKDKDTGDVYTKMEIKKNKVGSPYGKTEIRLLPGEGFDYKRDLILTALTKGIITKAGAFYTFGELKFQGKENLETGLLAKPEILAELEKAVIGELTTLRKIKAKAIKTKE